MQVIQKSHTNSMKKQSLQAFFSSFISSHTFIIKKESNPHLIPFPWTLSFNSVPPLPHHYHKATTLHILIFKWYHANECNEIWFQIILEIVHALIRKGLGKVKEEEQGISLHMIYKYIFVLYLSIYCLLLSLPVTSQNNWTVHDGWWNIHLS